MNGSRGSQDLISFRPDFVNGGYDGASLTDYQNSYYELKQ